MSWSDFQGLKIMQPRDILVLDIGRSRIVPFKGRVLI